MTPFQLGRQFCERFTYFFLPYWIQKTLCTFTMITYLGTTQNTLSKKPPYLSSIFTRISVAAAFLNCKHPPSFLHTAGISSLPSFPFKSKQTVCVCSASFSLMPPPHPLSTRLLLLVVIAAGRALPLPPLTRFSPIPSTQSAHSLP